MLYVYLSVEKILDDLNNVYHNFNTPGFKQYFDIRTSNKVIQV